MIDDLFDCCGVINDSCKDIEAFCDMKLVNKE
jgi:hypothetical protein